MTKFPKLYRIGATGKELVWMIWVEDDTIYESYGQVGGKLVDPGSGKLCKATNVGRSNERTPEEQALFEAESKWKKKLDKYEPKCEKGIKMAKEATDHKKTHGSNAKGGKARVNKDVYIVDKIPSYHKIGIMKGPEYKGKHDISEGGYVQPKYDGYRCKASCVDGKGVMTSSNGNQIVFLKHIKDDIASAIETFCRETDYKIKDICLDGEVYVHDPVDEDGKPITDRFNGCVTKCCNVRASKPHPYEPQMKYYVFDIDIDLPQNERIKLLKEFFSHVKNRSSLVMAPSYFIKSVEKMEKYIDYFIDEGYEGLIFRYKNGEYVPKKQMGLNAPVFKYKRMQDHEFEVIDAKPEVGKRSGRVVWICKTEDGVEFKASQPGETEYCRQLYKDRKKYIGKMLTVKFQDFSKDGAPRFPIAKAFRDNE